MLIQEKKICTKCKIEKDLSCLNKRNKCKDCIKEYNKKYYKKNKKQIKEYKEKNKKQIKEYRREYFKQRLKNDPVFKLRRRVSSTTGQYLKEQNLKKYFSTWIKLSYTPQQLKEHLEKQWEPWMSWENHRSL